ncbi:T9SS type A sorting domain-containing protein [Sinomicrobium sp. M5D2P9]
MKKKLLILSSLLWGLANYAQDGNGTTFTEVPPFTGIFATDPDLLKDYAFVQEKANQGDIHSLLFLGNMHLMGMGVEVNEDLAFKYYMKAARQGNLTAEYHIGNAYMKGAGCEIDFSKAMHWFRLSAEHGNEHAAYAIGYNYLKGFGVPQDYKKAIEWFESTPYVMAKHWLGNCYYFGYGVPRDTQKAARYYKESHTKNSKQLLKLIAQNAKETVDTAIINQLEEKDSLGNTGIGKEAIEALTITRAQQAQSKALKPKKLNGIWKGKLVRMDWSGKQIMQIVPLSCEFSVQDGNVNYVWEINGTTNEATAIWQDNALYFDELILGLDRPLSDTSYATTLYLKLLSAQMELKTINKKTYLVGNLETYDPIDREPGPPMRIILKHTEEGDEELLGLSRQEPHFIALYPNPFVNEVLIAYELDTEAQVSVHVYDLTGNPVPVTLEPGAWQTAGKHHYTLDGANLKAGIYIVRVTIGNRVYSRKLVKQ